MASDFTSANIDEIEAVARGGFRRVRATLGVTSFGMQVVELPPDFEQYPEHDHAHDGQEEVFVTLRGGGEIEVDGERTPLGPDVFVRVGPTARRKIWPGHGNPKCGIEFLCPRCGPARAHGNGSAAGAASNFPCQGVRSGGRAAKRRARGGLYSQ